MLHRQPIHIDLALGPPDSVVDCHVQFDIVGDIS